MKFTEKQLNKINSAKNAEELIALAKSEGIDMSEEEIRTQFESLHKEGEIADDELDNVAGGCGDDEESEEQPSGLKPKYSVGQRVRIGWGSYSDYYVIGEIVEISRYTDGGNGHIYTILTDKGNRETYYLDYDSYVTLLS